MAQAFPGFTDPSDYRGSPLASLKADPGLWEGGERQPAAVRQAARAVGEAAAAASAVAAGKKTSVNIEGVGATGAAGADVETGSSETGRSHTAMQMSPEIGKALMVWSETLREAGRPMAALMAVQAVVMGIMSIHRRHVLAGGEEVPDAAHGLTGDGEVVGDIVFGNLTRLNAEMFAVTGVEDVIFRSATLTFGKQFSTSSEGSDPNGVSSVLRGVPWLSVRDDGGLVWQPPAVVAEALDADLDDPTGWLAGLGGRSRSGLGEADQERDLQYQEEEDEEQGGQDKRLGRTHPCLQQFEAYFAHRDEVDFAVALFKAGFTGSAFLVLSRTVASAALPEGVGALSADGRINRPPALRGGGSPPSLSVLEEESRTREQVWSKPVLIHRFEELAGFRVVGRWGSLKAVGVDATFDYIAKGAPQLHESALGGKRMSKAEYNQGQSAASARAASALNGSSGHEDRAVASRRTTPFESSDDKSALRMPWSGTRSRAKRSANGRKNGRTSVELDSIPSVAFSPRFEAARFLLDLLSLRGSADESRRKREARRRLSLGRSVEVRGGTALLVAAALKGLQDEQEADSVGQGQQQQQQRGFLIDQLHGELYQLCAFKLGAERVLESLRAAPGVVQGARERYWWKFDSSAVEDAIGVAEGGCEAEVNEFRGFLTRYAWCGGGV